jgi:hypothetical protein
MQHLAQVAAEMGVQVQGVLPSQKNTSKEVDGLKPSGFEAKLQEIVTLSESSNFRDREIALNRLETLLVGGSSNAQKVKSFDLRIQILKKCQPQTESIRTQILQSELGKIAFSGKAAVLDGEGETLDSEKIQTPEAERTLQLQAFQSKYKKSLEARVVDSHIKVQTMRMQASALEKQLKAQVSFSDLDHLEQGLSQKEMQLASLLNSPNSSENRTKIESLLMGIRAEKQLLRSVCMK